MRGALLLSASTLLFAGCSDFLDIVPMDKVVLEDYWQEKADVTSAVNGCYAALASEAVITRMGVWGEMRSENVMPGSNLSNNNIREILGENLQPSNAMCDWSSFYNVINRCNVVMHYAPEVEKIDPNYTAADLDATIAEVTTLRALCYFYLIRAFRDVPYTTAPSIDDNQNYFLPATPFNDVVDSLINDLERVQDKALRRYELDKVENKSIVVPKTNNSRITRSAIYALLADLYLWKGDWDNVIKYCDKVLAYKLEVYKELQQKYQFTDVALYDSIPLILEAPQGSNNVGNAYTEIFGQGQSFESLFELYYNGTNEQNKWISTYYGSGDNNPGQLKAADFLADGFTDDNSQVFETQRDCRFYEGVRSEGTSYSIAKYRRTNASFSLQKLGSVQVSGNFRSSQDANWIIYRLTDVMLMKAEALIERSDDGFAEAFKLINDVYKRANGIAPDGTGQELAFEKYSGSKSQMEDLLFAERHREFLFEGKRWFDLVRATRREGKTTRLSSCVIRKHQQDVNVIKLKLADPNYVYFPYTKSELKANPLLVQNPAFNKGENSELK